MDDARGRDVLLVSESMHTCETMLTLRLRFKLLIGSGDSEGDSAAIIQTNAVERGVLALPGTVFLPNGRQSAYVRAAFSLLPPEDVEEAIKRLRDVILDARKVQ